MPVQFSDVFNLYQFPVGRAIFALKQAISAAQKLDAPGIVGYAQKAIEAAEAALDKEVRFRAQKGAPAYSPEATDRDQQADRTLSAFNDAFHAAAVIYQGGNTALARAAETLEREVFPRGVVAVTSLSYVEEHAFINGLLSRLEKGGDLSQEVSTLGLGGFVVRLREVSTGLGKALVRSSQGPTWDEIRAARATLQSALLRVVAAAVGQFVDDSDGAVKARTAVLGPILQQQEAIAAALKGRRGALTDVHPATGVEVPEAPVAG
jgi:hypothetical protein